MNLATSISIFAGGPGSGCNPAAGTCGKAKTKVFYHVTHKKKVTDIRKNGLLPKVPREVGDKKGVYLTPNFNDPDYRAYEHDTVFRVELPEKFKLEKDETHKGWFRTTQKIPAKYIKERWVWNQQGTQLIPAKERK